LRSTLSRRNASFSTGSLPPSSVYLVVMTTLIIPRLWHVVIRQRRFRVCPGESLAERIAAPLRARPRTFRRDGTCAHPSAAGRHQPMGSDTLPGNHAGCRRSVV